LLAPQLAQMPTHDRFDLQHWTAQFQLERLRAQAREFVLKRATKCRGNTPVRQMSIGMSS
jgi:hypothetical protein